jgi:hypothetical protein
MLLAANAPPRTTTALDEARVVCSLMQEDGRTAGQVARFLGHKPDWVARRIRLGTKLGPAGEEHLASRAIGPTLAHALTQLAEDDQDSLLQSIDKHGLRTGEALKVVEAYRAADPIDRKQLLRAPLEHLRAELQRNPILSPRAVHLEAELRRMRQALADLGAFQIPAELAPAEQRRLAAIYYGAIEQLRQLTERLCCTPVGTSTTTTQEMTGECKRSEYVSWQSDAIARPGAGAGRDGSEPGTHPARAAAAGGVQGQAGPQADPDSQGDLRGDPQAQRLLQRTPDRQTGEPAPGAGHACAASPRALAYADPAESNSAAEQARIFPRADRRARPQEADHDTHLAGDSQARIPGAQIDSGRLRAGASVPDGP